MSKAPSDGSGLTSEPHPPVGCGFEAALAGTAGFQPALAGRVRFQEHVGDGLRVLKPRGPRRCIVKTAWAGGDAL
jgi:hypothetical protein